MGNDDKPSLPSGSSSGNWIRLELNKKSDEKWVEAKLEPVEATAKEAKNIALASKRDWGRIKLGAVISIVVLVVSGIGQYFALKDSVEDNQEDLVEVKTEVAGVKGEVKKVKAIVEESKKEQKESDKKQLEEIKSAIKGAMHEVKADIRPDPPRRRRDR